MKRQMSDRPKRNLRYDFKQYNTDGRKVPLQTEVRESESSGEESFQTAGKSITSSENTSEMESSGDDTVKVADAATQTPPSRRNKKAPATTESPHQLAMPLIPDPAPRPNPQGVARLPAPAGHLLNPATRPRPPPPPRLPTITPHREQILEKYPSVLAALKRLTDSGGTTDIELNILAKVLSRCDSQERAQKIVDDRLSETTEETDTRRYSTEESKKLDLVQKAISTQARSQSDQEGVCHTVKGDTQNVKQKLLQVSQNLENLGEFSVQKTMKYNHLTNQKLGIGRKSQQLLYGLRMSYEKVAEEDEDTETLATDTDQETLQEAFEVMETLIYASPDLGRDAYVAGELAAKRAMFAIADIEKPGVPLSFIKRQVTRVEQAIRETHAGYRNLKVTSSDTVSEQVKADIKSTRNHLTAFLKSVTAKLGPSEGPEFGPVLQTHPESVEHNENKFEHLKTRMKAAEQAICQKMEGCSLDQLSTKKQVIDYKSTVLPSIKLKITAYEQVRAEFAADTAVSSRLTDNQLLQLKELDSALMKTEKLAQEWENKLTELVGDKEIDLVPSGNKLPPMDPGVFTGYGSTTDIFDFLDEVDRVLAADMADDAKANFLYGNCLSKEVKALVTNCKTSYTEMCKVLKFEFGEILRLVQSRMAIVEAIKCKGTTPEAKVEYWSALTRVLENLKRTVTRHDNGDGKFYAEVYHISTVSTITKSTGYHDIIFDYIHKHQQDYTETMTNEQRYDLIVKYANSRIEREKMDINCAPKHRKQAEPTGKHVKLNVLESEEFSLETETLGSSPEASPVRQQRTRSPPYYRQPVGSARLPVGARMLTTQQQKNQPSPYASPTSDGDMSPRTASRLRRTKRLRKKKREAATEGVANFVRQAAAAGVDTPCFVCTDLRDKHSIHDCDKFMSTPSEVRFRRYEDALVCRLCLSSKCVDEWLALPDTADTQRLVCVNKKPEMECKMCRKGNAKGNVIEMSSWLCITHSTYLQKVREDFMDRVKRRNPAMKATQLPRFLTMHLEEASGEEVVLELGRNTSNPSPHHQVAKNMVVDLRSGEIISEHNVEIVPEPDSPATHYLQQLNIAGRRTLVLFDSGATTSAITMECAKALGLPQISGEQSSVIVAGETRMDGKGKYTLSLGPSEGKYYQLGLIGVDVIAGPVEEVNMSLIESKVRSYDITRGNFLINDKFPEKVGGAVIDIVIGLKTAYLLPEELYTTRSGIIISRSKLIDETGSTVIIAGNLDLMKSTPTSQERLDSPVRLNIITGENNNCSNEDDVSVIDNETDYLWDYSFQSLSTNTGQWPENGEYCETVNKDDYGNKVAATCAPSHTENNAAWIMLMYVVSAFFCFVAMIMALYRWGGRLQENNVAKVEVKMDALGGMRMGLIKLRNKVRGLKLQKTQQKAEIQAAFQRGSDSIRPIDRLLNEEARQYFEAKSRVPPKGSESIRPIEAYNLRTGSGVLNEEAEDAGLHNMAAFLREPENIWPSATEPRIVIEDTTVLGLSFNTRIRGTGSTSLNPAHHGMCAYDLEEEAAEDARQLLQHLPFYVRVGCTICLGQADKSDEKLVRYAFRHHIGATNTYADDLFFGWHSPEELRGFILQRAEDHTASNHYDYHPCRGEHCNHGVRINSWSSAPCEARNPFEDNVPWP